MEIIKIVKCLTLTLELSTAHLPELDLDPEEDFGDTRTVKHHYGYILFVALPLGPEGEQDIQDSISDHPDWLQPILRLAIANECAYINFDCDGPIIEGLPTHIG